MSRRTIALLQALFVTVLWSTSWILIKFGLQEIPPLTFAGLRYMLAALCLLPFVLRQTHLSILRRLSRKTWGQLLLLGLLFYTLTQGSSFVGLAFLRPATLSLILSFTPAVVALLAYLTLGESLSRLQAVGISIYLAGVAVYFLPAGVGEYRLMGLAAGLVGLLANSASSVLGRHLNRSRDVAPIAITATSMLFGAALLLLAGGVSQGIPRLSFLSWAIIAWLAVVNTAFAFTWWNVTLRTLSAMESSIINNTMLIQIAILAWVFLGDRLQAWEIAGLVLAAAGALLVQLRPRPRPLEPPATN